MATVIVKLPRAAQGPLDSTVRLVLQENLKFAFPQYTFRFVSEPNAEGFAIVLASGDRGRRAVDDLDQIQTAVKRITEELVKAGGSQVRAEQHGMTATGRSPTREN
jgi:hypothetical protein